VASMASSRISKRQAPAPPKPRHLSPAEAIPEEENASTSLLRPNPAPRKNTPSPLNTGEPIYTEIKKAKKKKSRTADEDPPPAANDENPDAITVVKEKSKKKKKKRDKSRDDEETRPKSESPKKDKKVRDEKEDPDAIVAIENGDEQKQRKKHKKHRSKSRDQEEASPATATPSPEHERDRSAKKEKKKKSSKKSKVEQVVEVHGEETASSSRSRQVVTTTSNTNTIPVGDEPSTSRSPVEPAPPAPSPRTPTPTTATATGRSSSPIVPITPYAEIRPVRRKSPSLVSKIRLFDAALAPPKPGEGAHVAELSRLFESSSFLKVRKSPSLPRLSSSKTPSSNALSSSSFSSTPVVELPKPSPSPNQSSLPRQRQHLAVVGELVKKFSQEGQAGNECVAKHDVPDFALNDGRVQPPSHVRKLATLVHQSNLRFHSSNRPRSSSVVSFYDWLDEEESGGDDVLVEQFPHPIPVLSLVEATPPTPARPHPKAKKSVSFEEHKKWNDFLKDISHLSFEVDEETEAFL